MDGSVHDKRKGGFSKVPKSIVKKLKGKSQWKKYEKKQKKVAEARKKVQGKPLWQIALDPSAIFALVAALGMTIGKFTVWQWSKIFA
ncbi:hypothetical protein DI291_0625 [Bacillus paralicheniformis]|nr:hypothetical protein EI977_15115 [Bacillus paralicheniformis]KAA0843122.1 hypothetical protein EI979_03420 [Bacillus paralicheniformis]QSG00078.1 hypothetical protein DI291_0625 [Bacillus paralicheniformis]